MTASGAAQPRTAFARRPRCPLGPTRAPSSGAGGSLVAIDLDARLCFAYVMNKLGATTLGDTRGLGPAAATFAAALSA